jgi:protein-L-isoaspartate(D-aspartate) O-methyltransferase
LFDAIAVHAAMPGEPEELLAQLAPGGRLVAPVAEPRRGPAEPEEHLVLWRCEDRDPARLERETIVACRFVPMIGAAGYPEPPR